MSSKLMDYFNKQPRLGTLSTSSKDGKVNSAYFGSPYMVDEKTIGGGPRCLDSLMGGISSESVFGFFVLLLRSIRLPQRRDEAVRNKPHPGCGRQERSGRVRGCKSRSIRLAPAAVRNRS
jgi:hypothetical protein